MTAKIEKIISKIEKNKELLTAKMLNFINKNPQHFMSNACSYMYYNEDKKNKRWKKLEEQNKSLLDDIKQETIKEIVKLIPTFEWEPWGGWDDNKIWAKDVMESLPKHIMKYLDILVNNHSIFRETINYEGIVDIEICLGSSGDGNKIYPGLGIETVHGASYVAFIEKLGLVKIKEQLDAIKKKHQIYEEEKKVEKKNELTQFKDEGYVYDEPTRLLKELYTIIDEITNSDEFQGVFAMSAIHGGQYSGKNMSKELKDTKKYFEKLGIVQPSLTSPE